MSTSAQNSLESVHAAVRSRGLRSVAHDLNMPRLTLASALLGRARAGTLALIAARWRALALPEARP